MNKTLEYRCMPRHTIANDMLSLSCVQPEHIEPIRKWRNAQIAVLRQKTEITQQQQIEYFSASVWPELTDPRPKNILLSLHRDDTLVGYGGLVHMAWSDLRAEVSFLLDPQIPDSGSEYHDIYRNYLELICDFAFDDLRFNRLCTETYASRMLHIQTLESAGFQKEGVLREHTIQWGVPTDSIVHGRLTTNRTQIR